MAVVVALARETYFRIWLIQVETKLRFSLRADKMAYILSGCSFSLEPWNYSCGTARDSHPIPVRL